MPRRPSLGQRRDATGKSVSFQQMLDRVALFFQLLERGDELVAGGLLRGADELVAARQLAHQELGQFRRGRLRRCLGNSTEFCRVLSWRGVEHRQRGELPTGQWLPPSASALQQWLGQRALQVFENRPPAFPAFFRKWWWFRGKGSLYLPRACSQDRIESELSVAAAGFVRYRDVILGLP